VTPRPVGVPLTEIYCPCCEASFSSDRVVDPRKTLLLCLDCVKGDATAAEGFRLAGSGAVAPTTVAMAFEGEDPVNLFISFSSCCPDAPFAHVPLQRGFSSRCRKMETAFSIASPICLNCWRIMAHDHRLRRAI
jgi:hypothetical protein